MKSIQIFSVMKIVFFFQQYGYSQYRLPRNNGFDVMFVTGGVTKCAEQPK